MPWGGSEMLWYQSALEALSSGYKVYVSIYDWPNLPAPLVELKEKGAVIIKRRRSLTIRQRLIQKIGEKIGFGLAIDQYSRLRKLKPDIVVVTDGCTYYTANDSKLSRFLLTNNNYFIISQANSLSHRPVDRKSAIQLFQRARQIIFVSEQNRTLATHQLAHKLSNTSVIQNPVVLNGFEMLPFPSLNTTIHIAVVGRLSVAEKGQDIILRVFQNAFWKDKDFTVHFYGKGNDQQYLKELIKFFGLENKVIIEGHISDITNIWEQCHCLLMCSHIEGTPLSLLEAMVLGRVCIVTDAGGNKEWVKNKRNGFLAPHSTEESLLATMVEAWDMLPNWPSIAEMAHADIIKRLDKTPGRTLLTCLEVNSQTLAKKAQ